MTVRWGIIGCGDIADKRIAPAINEEPNSELAAVMRRDAEKVREFAKRHKAKKYYTDIEALLKDDEIDAVYIATPIYLHCDQTLLVAEHGKHVLCEKPMAMNLKECERMISACKKNNVKLGVSYYRRFYPKVKKMKRILEEGTIGEAVLIRVQYTGWYNPSLNDPKAWRVTPEKGGGGVLMDTGSHRLDLVVYLMGLPKEVSAFTDTQAFNYPVEDSAVLMMRFSSGACGVANFNWNTKGRTNDFEVYGTKGKIIATPLKDENLVLYTDEEKKFKLSPAKNVHFPLIQDFVESIRLEGEPAIPGEEGMKTSKILWAVYESSRKGRTVKII